MLFLFMQLMQLNRAQKSDLYFVLLNKDTLFCKAIQHKVSSTGRLTYFCYTTIEDKKTECKSRFDVPKLNCFRYSKQTYEMIPRRSYNIKKRNILGKRLVDGELTYCYYNNEQFGMQSTTNYKTGMRSNETVKTGFKLRYVKFKEGTYLKLTKKSMRKKTHF